MPKSIEGVMHEFKHGKLHSGSKKGPKVTSRKQAVAIALSEQRQRGKGVKYRPHGSGPFSDSDIARGYKVCYTSNQLHKMKDNAY